MTEKQRTIRIWTSLVAAMTVGAIVLMAMDDHKIREGGFSLASFRKLISIEYAVDSSVDVKSGRWDNVRVILSGTSGGNVENVALSQGILDSSEANLHFLVGNGVGAQDGHIIKSDRWDKQLSCDGLNSGKTIIVCVVADGEQTRVTDIQSQRVLELVSYFCREYRIDSYRISYPAEF